MQEKELIDKVLQGDEEAFGLLMQQNREAIFRHCLSIVHHEEIAKDLTQETFVHAFHHLSSFRKESRFSTWVWRIAHNLSLSYIKKRRPLEQEFNEEILIPFSTNHQKESNEERKESLMRAIKQLDPKYRAVIELYDLERLPQKEIAVKLGIPYGTVRSRLHYGRKALKKFLEEA